MTKVVYISSPYTLGDKEQNVKLQILAADRLRQSGYFPEIPLLYHYWDKIKPHDYEYWMSLCLEMVERCDIVLRLPGESKGADIECERARELGISVYYSICELGECDAST